MIKALQQQEVEGECLEAESSAKDPSFIDVPAIYQGNREILLGDIVVRPQLVYIAIQF